MPFFLKSDFLFKVVFKLVNEKLMNLNFNLKLNLKSKLQLALLKLQFEVQTSTCTSQTSIWSPNFNLHFSNFNLNFKPMFKLNFLKLKKSNFETGLAELRILKVKLKFKLHLSHSVTKKCQFIASIQFYGTLN